MKSRWAFLDRWSDLGLLIMRLVVGSLFALVHGWLRLIEGPSEWLDVGSVLGHMGVGFGHMFFGFLALLIETAGGVLIAIGLWHRPVAAALSVVMLIASLWEYYHPFYGLPDAAHPIALLSVCLGLMFTGPGKWSLDSR